MRSCAIVTLLLIVMVGIGCARRETAEDRVNRVLWAGHNAILLTVRANETAFNGGLIDGEQHFQNEMKVVACAKAYNVAHDKADGAAIDVVLDELRRLRDLLKGGG